MSEVLVGKPYVMEQLGRLWHSWADNIIMSLEVRGYEGVDFIQLTQDRTK
jgi:hypothetical protein